VTVRNRVPPGQTVTAKWPVLTYGDTPRIDTSRWRFRIFGAVENRREWTWAELLARPAVEIQSDVHCVTRWSRLDNRWRHRNDSGERSTMMVRPSGRSSHWCSAKVRIEIRPRPIQAGTRP
jgi:DMSO/TMAO reductase YedYZ molybdopterin-dependent catalytic subunit